MLLLMNIHILFQTFLTLDIYPIPRLLHSLSQFLLQLAQPNELEAAHSSKQPNSLSLLCSCLSDPCISFVPSSVLQDSITAPPLAHEQAFESSSHPTNVHISLLDPSSVGLSLQVLILWKLKLKMTFLNPNNRLIFAPFHILLYFIPYLLCVSQKGLNSLPSTRGG